MTGITPDIDLTPLDAQRSTSRRHAKLYQMGSVFYLMEEIGVMNGTFVNDSRLATGAPVLQGAVGAIDCELIETIERYNVVMILGRVVATSSDPQAAPLVHFRGGYLP